MLRDKRAVWYRDGNPNTIGSEVMKMALSTVLPTGGGYEPPWRIGGAAPALSGDAAILAAFRRWQGNWRTPEFGQPLLRAIAETPSSGFTGICIKIFLATRGAVPDGGGIEADADQLAMIDAAARDIARLVAREVPELAVVVAPLAG
jgi:hypothetical protein